MPKPRFFDVTNTAACSFWVRIVLAGCLMLLAVPAAVVTAQDSPEDSEQELKNLREIAQSLPDAHAVYPDDMEKAADGIRILPGFRENCARIRKQFGSKLEIRQQPYSELEYELRFREGEMKQYEQMMRDNVVSVDLVKRDLERIGECIKIAVDNQAPAWFRPDKDLYKTLRTARARVGLVEILDGASDQTAELAKQIDVAEKQIAEAAQALSKEILESNPLPPDDYQGSDRDDLLKLLDKKWAASGNQQKILSRGIVAADWKRETRWEWLNSAFHLRDVSRIQGWVLIQMNDTVAARFSLDFVKDHLAGDEINTGWVNDPAQPASLQSQILLSKVSGK